MQFNYYTEWIWMDAAQKEEYQFLKIINIIVFMQNETDLYAHLLRCSANIKCKILKPKHYANKQ